MKPLLIIGFGNDLRGDDALGPMAARRLMQKFDSDPNVRFEICQGLTPDLALPISEARRVIFIDCAATGEPGELVHRRIEARADGDMSMVHFLDPDALLSWTRRLYGQCPDAEIFSVGGASFDISETLSPPVAEALPRLMEWVIAAVQACESPAISPQTSL